MMNAVEYFEIKNRMTKNCTIDCRKCGIYNAYDKLGKLGIDAIIGCSHFEMKYPEKAVEIVEQWGKEHPIKTRAQVFFEKFPDAPKYEDGAPMICPRNCGFVFECAELCKYNTKKWYECWQEPAPEKYQELEG